MCAGKPCAPGCKSYWWDKVSGQRDRCQPDRNGTAESRAGVSGGCQSIAKELAMETVISGDKINRNEADETVRRPIRRIRFLRMQLSWLSSVFCSRWSHLHPCQPTFRHRSQTYQHEMADASREQYRQRNLGRWSDSERSC